jgi:hypothetical protein
LSNNTQSDDSREQICKIVFKELDFFEQKMSSLMPLLNSAKLQPKSIEIIDSSIKLLIKIVDIYLRNDQEYIEKENSESFGVYLTNIEEAIKAFFKAYIIENNLTYRVLRRGEGKTDSRKYNDSIDSLMHLMYDSLAEKRRRNIDYAYPSIIRAVKFVKNLQHHEIIDVPTDYRTEVQSFGNIFTLCSILILVFRAYVEMIEEWLETLKNYRI